MPWPDLPGLLAEERAWGRFPLWLPVLFGCGILTFFSVSADPAPVVATLLSLGLLMAAWLGRRRAVAGPVAAALAALALGFTTAAWRLEAVRAPALEHPARGTMTGIVERVETRSRGYRLWLKVETFDGAARVTAPERLRATVTRKGSEPHLGSRVALDGLWRPPPGPVRPGGYDWGRDAFFLGLGAVGLADGPPRVIEGQPEPSVRQKLSEAIGKTRNAIAKRIGGILSGPVGAIAASLVVGERGAIPERINEAMRVSGLAHVLSISGLHMAMFAGLIYQGVRILLALSGSLALRYPIRKWAAVMAAFAAFGYLLLSGAEIAAQRSFLMAALAFLAIVLDRSVLTVRSVALAAGLLLVAFPEAVLSISFQMSFAAVLALIAAYEAWRDRRVEREGERRGWFWRLTIGAIMASLVTTLVAGLATAPFGAFYFQRTGVYSLLANLAAMPLIGAIIMPGAVVGLLLYPFGLDGWAWSVMGFGISGMVWVAEQVAALPGAAWHSAAFGTGAFLLMGLALVWACLWRTSLRLLAILPLVIGIAFAATNQRPDIYIEPEGRAMAVRHPDGQLRITGLRFARFAAGNWLAADGDSRDLQDRGITSDVYCDRAACRLTLPDGRAAVLAWTYQALREDCGRAALVVTRLVAPPGCRAVTYVVDAEDLAARGAVTLKLDGGDFRIASVREPSAARAWYNRPVVRRPDFPKIPSTSSEPSEDTSEDPAASDATGPDGALQ